MQSNTYRDLARDYVLFAREMCPDDLIKKMFHIHLLWNDLEANDFVGCQVKRLDNAESKEDPHVMLIDGILLEENLECWSS